jgi:hypothetical protein
MSSSVGVARRDIRASLDIVEIKDSSALMNEKGWLWPSPSVLTRLQPGTSRVTC